MDVASGLEEQGAHKPLLVRSNVTLVTTINCGQQLRSPSVGRPVHHNNDR